MICALSLFFFFSSRRRHTRLQGDWSSDVCSSDLLVPGLSLHEELSLLVGAGLTPLEALTAATRKGAELMHADSLGRIAPGKVADLVEIGRASCRERV